MTQRYYSQELIRVKLLKQHLLKTCSSKPSTKCVFASSVYLAAFLIKSFSFILASKLMPLTAIKSTFKQSLMLIDILK